MSLRREILDGGAKCSFVLHRHQRLRLTATSERSSCAMLLYRADRPIERYNMPDTLKAQHTFFLSAGRVLLSDMGHVLAGIVRDDVGWHDTVTGHQDAAGSLARYGEGSYQRLRNRMHRNTRDNLLIELGKWELGPRDLHASINWFTKVVADETGKLAWQAQASAGQAVELRAELDCLVVLSNTPHPLDPWPDYAPAPIELGVADGPPPPPDDPCRISRPEAGRTYQLTEALFR